MIRFGTPYNAQASWRWHLLTEVKVILKSTHSMEMLALASVAIIRDEAEGGELLDWRPVRAEIAKIEGSQC